MNFEYGEDCEGQQGWGYMTRESVKSVKGVMITVQDSEEGVWWKFAGRAIASTALSRAGEGCARTELNQ